jgi:DNA-binding response OmpR family regulator
MVWTLNEQAHAELTSPQAAGGEDQGRKSILIVEDEPEIRELIRETLTVEDFEFLESDTAERAWNMIRQQKPDLVLLDILLPGNMDGLDLCKKIKSDKNTERIPVLFVTAVPINELQTHEMKADGVFYKPFSPMELIDKVLDVLGMND